jgi:hypothetical protein
LQREIAPFATRHLSKESFWRKLRTNLLGAGTKATGVVASGQVNFGSILDVSTMRSRKLIEVKGPNAVQSSRIQLNFSRQNANERLQEA